jgi:hypothetical protein
MEVVASQKSHTNYTKHIQNDIVELNMIEGYQAMGSINEKLTFPSQVPYLSG